MPGLNCNGHSPFVLHSIRLMVLHIFVHFQIILGHPMKCLSNISKIPSSIPNTWPKWWYLLDSSFCQHCILFNSDAIVIIQLHESNIFLLLLLYSFQICVGMLLLEIDLIFPGDEASFYLSLSELLLPPSVKMGKKNQADIPSYFPMVHPHWISSRWTRQMFIKSLPASTVNWTIMRVTAGKDKLQE